MINQIGQLILLTIGVCIFGVTVIAILIHREQKANESTIFYDEH